MAKNRKKLRTQAKVTDTRVVKPRDLNILASVRGEIKMNTTCNTPNKRAYSRKSKHRNAEY
jgi:hypothetical protein